MSTVKKWIVTIALAALLVCMLKPGVSYTEDRSTVMLAMAIYEKVLMELFDKSLSAYVLP